MGTDETTHYWDGHGRGRCGLNVWEGLNVVRTLRLTTDKDAVTCGNCKVLMERQMKT